MFVYCVQFNKWYRNNSKKGISTLYVTKMHKNIKSASLKENPSVLLGCPQAICAGSPLLFVSLFALMGLTDWWHGPKFCAGMPKSKLCLFPYVNFFLSVALIGVIDDLTLNFCVGMPNSKLCMFPNVNFFFISCFDWCSVIHDLTLNFCARMSN